MGRSVRIALLSAGAAAAASTLAHGAGSSRRDALLNPSALEPGEQAAPPARAPTGWPTGPDGRPIGLRLKGAPGDRASGGVASDLSAHFGAVARGTAGGADGSLATLDTGFESLAPLPAPLLNQLDTVTWGGGAAGVTGRAHFSAPGTNVTGAMAGVVTTTVAGNATKKLRGFAETELSGVFDRWARFNFLKTSTAQPNQPGAERFTFRPDTGANLRIVHDVWVNSIDSTWGLDPADVTAATVTARLFWGGQNSTPSIGLPIGPIPDFYMMVFTACDELCFEYAFRQCRFVGSAPPGKAVGDPASPAVGAWFRLAMEFDVLGRTIVKADYLDGSGEHVVWFDDTEIGLGRVSRMAWLGGFENQGDTMYVDNLRVEGAEYTPPITPPLVCAGWQYTDDQQWLQPGALTGQSSRWSATRETSVLEPGDNGNPFPTNAFATPLVFPTGFYQYAGPRTFGTALPLTVAWPGESWLLSWPAHLAGTYPLNALVQQQLALRSASEGLVARVVIVKPQGAAGAKLVVQTSPLANPSIGVSGPGFADTGVAWPLNESHTLRVGVDNDRTLRVYIDDTLAYTGAAFGSAIDRAEWETWPAYSPQGYVPDSVLFTDDISLSCVDFQTSTPPPLTVPYADDFEWAHAGVSVGVQDDDANPATPFRWTNAGPAPVEPAGAGAATKFLRVPNADLSTFTDLQARAWTTLPALTATTTVRGWAVATDNRLSDYRVSRAWSLVRPPELTSPFSRDATLALSATTGTFVLPRPNVAAPDTRATPASVGVVPGEWFPVSIRRAVSGLYSFRVNGRLLRYGPGHAAQGEVVLVSPLHNAPDPLLGAFLLLAGEENETPGSPPSHHDLDNLRVWSLPCLGDANENGVVNFADLNIVLANFGATPLPGAYGSDLPGNIAPDADTDGVPDDDIVNFADLNAVLSGFGVPCSAQN